MDLATDPTPLLDLVRAREQAFLDELAGLVAIDSGSRDADGVDRVGAHVADRLAALGCAVEHVGDPSGRSGAVVIGLRPAAREGAPTVLLSAHMDTVFDRGDAAARPFRVEGDRAHGPGVADDKAGLVCGLTALDVLEDAGQGRDVGVLFVASSDEEIGSPHSQTVLERVASEADVALCLECARPGGEVVTRRKGGAVVEIRFTGRAAHAGIEPEKGIHAGLAAAWATVALHQLAEVVPDITVNVGVLRAGRVANAVPDAARLLVDVRAWDADRLSRALEGVRAAAEEVPVRGVRSAMDVVERFAPMGPTAASKGLVARSGELAERLGFTLTTASTGGGGDANTLAGLGLPVLDGLGPVGGDYHAPTEWLDLASVVPRTALLAALIATGGGADVRTGSSAGPDGASG